MIVTLLALSVLASDPTTDGVLLRLNYVRALAGSGPLVIDPTLCTTAIIQARKCAAQKRMFHSGSILSGVKEGVCYHFQDPVYALATTQTPLHRADAIDRNCTRLGVGWAYSSDGEIFWVLQYAP